MGINRENPDYMTTRGERTSYWSFFVGQSFSYTLMVMILPSYLLMLGVDIGKIAVAIFFVKVWDAVNDVFFGFIFDKVQFKNRQKCIPWIRISTVVLPICSVLMFLIPGGASENLKLIWFVVAHILWDSAYTLTDVPIYSLVTGMTSNHAERNSVLSTGRLAALLGAGASFMVCTVLISEQVGMGFRPMALLVCFFIALMMIPIGITGRERIVPETTGESYTLRSTLRYVRTNKYLLLCYGGYLISGLLSTAGAVELFVSYYLFGSALFSTLMYAVSGVPMIIIGLLMPRLLKRFDKFKLYRNCVAVTAVLGILIYFIGYKNIAVYIALTALRAIPFSVVNILSLTFVPDCVEYGFYKSGVDARGIAVAVQSFAAKFASVGQSIALVILGLFSWITIEASSFAELETQGIVQMASGLNGLWFTYMLVPAIGGLLSLIPYALYKLNDKDVQIMTRHNSGEINREEAQAQLSRSY